MKRTARINTSFAVVGIMGCLVVTRAAGDSTMPYLPTMNAAIAMTATLPRPQPMDMDTPMTTPMMRDGMVKAEMTDGAAQHQKYMHEMLGKEQSTIDGGKKISP